MTITPIGLRPAASSDVEEAVDRYLSEAGEDIALAFVAALEAAYEHIARNPSSGSPRYAIELGLPGLRAWRVRGFPYLIFYAEGGDGCEVWRVLHGERDIPRWLGSPGAGTANPDRDEP